MTSIKKQCNATINIGLTDLTYNCLIDEGHTGPHHIGISSEFYLIHEENDVEGIFGTISDLKKEWLSQ